MLTPRGHPPRSRTFLRSAWASLALAVALVGPAAPPSFASVEGVTAGVDVSCDRHSSPEAVVVSVAAANRTAQSHVVVLEVSNRPELVTPLGPGTPGNPSIATGSIWIPSSEWVGAPTVAVRLGIGSSYIYGPYTYTNPCAPDTEDPQPPVTASDVWVYCNEDEAEPRLFVAASLDNEGTSPEAVVMELSGRPNTKVSIPGSSFVTAATWWTMAEAGDEVRVTLVLESLDLVIFEGSFPNVCLELPEPVMPEPAAPSTPEAPLGLDEGQVLETAMPVEPTTAGDSPVVAGEAADTPPGILPRTGASSLVIGAAALLLLLFGLMLARFESHDGTVDRTVRS
jgi:hypothetical protein